MLQFSANLYRIVQSCASNEDIRYYLNGVFVEPAKGRPGVTLTSTDGHRLLCVYDVDGRADESAIVKLSKFALKACNGRNQVHIATGSQVARVHEVPKFVYSHIDDLESLTVLASTGIDPVVRTETRYDADYGVECQVTVRGYSSESCKIDGIFPDYRRVIPSMFGGATWGAHFNASYVEAFGKIAGELAMHFNDSRSKADGQVRFLTNDATGPSIVRFNTDKAFGVLMPMRGNDNSVGVPEWFNEPPAIAAPPIAQIEYQEAA